MIYLLILNLIVSFTLNANDSDDESQFNPENGRVGIVGFSARGTGCPAGSTDGIISGDNEVITVVFDSYKVIKNPGETNRVGKNCRMAFELDAPAGWSHAVYSMLIEGYADLEEGLIGIQNLGYSYSDGRGRQSLGRLKLEGPFADEYIRT